MENKLDIGERLSVIGRFRIEGRLSVIRSDRKTGEIIEKMTAKNAMLKPGALSLVKALFDPSTDYTIDSKLTQIIVVGQAFIVNFRKNVPDSFSYQDRGDRIDLELIWIDNLDAPYDIYHGGIVPKSFTSENIDEIFDNFCLYARLPSVIYKKASEVVTYRWTISIPYSTR